MVVVALDHRTVVLLDRAVAFGQRTPPVVLAEMTAGKRVVLRRMGPVLLMGAGVGIVTFDHRPLVAFALRTVAGISVDKLAPLRSGDVELAADELLAHAGVPSEVSVVVVEFST